MRSFFQITPMIAALSAVAVAEPVRSGHAQVEWLAKSSGYSPGEPVVTALKMTLDKGWHTYWINPGEAGFPLTSEFSLPEGWTAEPPHHPFPIRFKTGELSDFGYEGTVLFPVVLHPPDGAQGDVELKATFSWLTCNDDACVPGDATLALPLKSNAKEPTPAAAEIDKSIALTPTPAPDGWKLGVTQTGDSVILKLTLPDAHDHEQLDIFPLTVNIVHPAAKFEWRNSGTSYTAIVEKSPFAPDQIESLELAINAPSLIRPIYLGWNAK
jgi:thiol:disulfide interchange protein DsbD